MIAHHWWLLGDIDQTQLCQNSPASAMYFFTYQLEFQSFVFAASFNFWVNPAWLSQHPDRCARSAPISSITGKTCPYPRDRNASCVNRNYTSTCRGSPTISCINAKTPRLIKRGWASVYINFQYMKIIRKAPPKKIWGKKSQACGPTSPPNRFGTIV